MNGAIAPLRTQIAKVKSKYRNEANSVGACPALRKVLNPATLAPSGRPGTPGFRGRIEANANPVPKRIHKPVQRTCKSSAFGWLRCAVATVNLPGRRSGEAIINLGMAPGFAPVALAIGRPREQDEMAGRTEPPIFSEGTI
ncbi:MAG: hypothetical protein ABI781_09110 [Burkholderiales bacterium]